MPYMSQIRYPSKKNSLQELLPFQSQKTQSRTSQSSIQSIQNSVQNGRWSIISPHPTFSCNQPCNPRKHFLPLFKAIFTSLLAHKTIRTISTNNSFFDTPVIFRSPIFTYSHSHNTQQKSFLLSQPFSQFRLHHEPNERVSLVWTDTDFLLFRLKKFVYFWLESLMEMRVVIRMASHPLHPPPYLQSIIVTYQYPSNNHHKTAHAHENQLSNSNSFHPKLFHIPFMDPSSLFLKILSSCYSFIAPYQRWK